MGFVYGDCALTPAPHFLWFMLPTVLRRWTWCYSYFMCGFVGLAAVSFMLSLDLHFVLVFFDPYLLGRLISNAL